MIQPLRDYHRIVSFALAFLTPTIFFVAIARRPPDPFPDQSRGHRGIDKARVLAANWRKYNIGVEQLDGGQRLKLTGELPASDPLLYCSMQQIEGILPTDAAFVGELLTERTYSVPKQCRPFATWYVFSGATRTVLDSATLGAQP